MPIQDRVLDGHHRRSELVERLTSPDRGGDVFDTECPIADVESSADGT